MLAPQLGHQFLLASQQPGAQVVHIQPRLLGLGKNTLGWRFFFLHVVLDLFGQDRDLGVEKPVIRAASQDFGDHHLCAIMLDIGFRHHIVVHFALACRVEKFLFNGGVNHQFGTDFLRQLHLPIGLLSGFKTLEKLLNLAMVCL